MNKEIEDMYSDDISYPRITGLGTKEHEEAYMKAFNIACENASLSIKPYDIEIKDKQVGGSHYQNKIQPWTIIDSWGLNFYEGNILKYLLRHKDNRVQDIEKLIHYAEKLLELERGKPTKV